MRFFQSLATPLALCDFNSETEGMVLFCRRNIGFFFSRVNIVPGNLLALYQKFD
jgi:hypothetical protein